MICIVKSPAPAKLVKREQKELATLKATYLRDPKGCVDGSTKIQIKSSVYTADYVRAALKEDQRSKCAFCESEYGHVGFGDVEHYRPKAGWRQKRGDDLSWPGYYWLAYNWDNLFLSCALCNQAFKENLFPIKNQSNRATNHLLSIAAEEPLIAMPSGNPEKYIGFYGETAVPKNNSTIGKTTIECLGINRNALIEYRLEVLKSFKVKKDALDLLLERFAPPRPAEVQAVVDGLEMQISAARSSIAPYSAMINSVP